MLFLNFLTRVQEEERSEAMAAAREEEERMKEMHKLAQLQVRLASFPYPF